MFGNGATYDSMEGRFRTYRKEAEKLKREAADKGVSVNGNGSAGGRSGGTPRTPRSGKGGVTKSTGKKGDSSTAKSIKAHFDGTPTKNKKTVFGPGTSPNEAISLDEDDEGEIPIKDVLKEEMEELLFETPTTKPKVEKRGGTRLFDIAPEKKVDSQANGYVAPGSSNVATPTNHVEKEQGLVEEHTSDYEDAYEYEDMA